MKQSKAPSFLATTLVRMKAPAGAIKNNTNTQKKGKHPVLVRSLSIVMVQFLTGMLKPGYIGEFEIPIGHSWENICEPHRRLNKRGAPDLVCNSKIQKHGRTTCSHPFSLVLLY